MEGEGAALCTWGPANNSRELLLFFHLLETGSLWFPSRGPPDKLFWERPGDSLASSAHLAVEGLGLKMLTTASGFCLFILF